MMAALRALLALILLAGIYVLAVSVFLIWLAFAILAVWALGNSPTPNPTPILVTAAMFLPVMFIIGEVAQMSRPAGPRPGSVPLPADRAPALRQAVDDLAAAVGTAPPDEIRLVPDVNAYVTDESWLLGLRRGRRTLYLGAPLLVGLRPEELRAILCHELGHFSRRHAWFTGPVFRGTAALDRAKAQIRDAQQANPMIRNYGWTVYAAVAGYAAIVNRLTMPIRRRQELEADRIAAATAGPDALAGALCSVAAVAAFWSVFEREFLVPHRKATGTVPDDPYHAFAVMLDDPDAGEPMSRARLLALEQPAPAGDPHPSLAERITRLDELPEPSGGRTAVAPDVDGKLFVRLAEEQDGTPAEQAWPDWLGAMTDHRSVMPAGDDPAMWGPAVHTQPSGQAPARRMPWRDWLAALAEHRATQILIPLARAAREVSAGGGAKAEPTLRTILDLLDRRQGRKLARALDPGAPRDLESDWLARDRLITAVSALIGHALVRRGTAYWTMGWFGPSRLVAADADQADIANWVSTAIDDPDQVSWLRMQLSGCRIDAAKVAIVENPDADDSVPPAPARTMKIAPAVPEAARGRRKSISYTTLVVLGVLLSLGGMVYLGREDPEPRYRPTPQRTAPWIPYRQPTQRPLLPTDFYQPRPLPSLIVPWLPTIGP